MTWLTRALYALGMLVLVALAVLWLYGCSPSPKDQAAAVDLALAGACGDVVAKAESEEPTCKKAEARINASAACRALKPEGLSLDCKEDRK